MVQQSVEATVGGAAVLSERADGGVLDAGELGHLWHGHFQYNQVVDDLDSLGLGHLLVVSLEGIHVFARNVL